MLYAIDDGGNIIVVVVVVVVDVDENSDNCFNVGVTLNAEVLAADNEI